MSSQQIPVVFKTHRQHVAGFNNGEMTINCHFGDRLSDVISNLNNFRSPDAQIKHLLSIKEREIPSYCWNIPIKEKLIFNVKFGDE